MSISDGPAGDADFFDPSEHLTSYIFTSSSSDDTVPLRPKKRRKVSRTHETSQDVTTSRSPLTFPALFNGSESSACFSLRHRLFEESWNYTNAKIQSILREANETTLGEVTSFIDEAVSAKYADQIPTGLIVTGPNIASQELLFGQIAATLRSHAHGTVTVLRSGDAPNLKTLFKKLIRDATNKREDDGEDAHTSQKDGRKLLNYDLQILHDHLKSSKANKIVVAIQDSEAFDSDLIGEMLAIFRSWLDRIPFVVLFGIATSVDLFQERLPRAATRYLHGRQFDVEQASQTLQKVFRKVIASCEAPLLLGPGLVTAILERQHDHVQSLQAFVNALKYAYMTHYYANPLSILLGGLEMLDEVFENTQSEHLEAIRMLPSFQRKIENLLNEEQFREARGLLNSNNALLIEVGRSLENRREFITNSLRTMHVFATVVSTELEHVDRMNIYVEAFSGQIENSQFLQDFLSSVKILSPADTVSLTKKIVEAVGFGDPESGLLGWTETAEIFLDEIFRIESAVQRLMVEAEALDTPIRSKHSLQSKILRTTVVAQKVQLSKEKSLLSKMDISYSRLLDELTDLLKDYFKFENPFEIFLHEVWLYDSKSPIREVFTPRPRYAMERALSVPHDYLGCACCRASEEGLSASQPTTAIIYQLYLETGGLINVFDLWSAFYTIMGGDDGEDCDERNALVQFYKALADLKLLGMVKQSRKKTDHLAKLAWKGL